MFDLTVAAAAQRIEARNKLINAFITMRIDDALREAGARAAESPRSPLHGLPYSLKDEWETAGIRTTSGSFRYADRISSESSMVHQAFEEAGAVLVGKSNLSDLGMAPEASSWLAGSTRNPHDLTRTAGGSSGGAAAAVADGMVAFDWGSDIGGSIRMPAAFCGVLGLKLSSETWPISGFFPKIPRSVEWMCGQGPLTRTLGQMRAVLAAAAPRVRTGNARSFSLRGAYLWAPDQLGQWPTFAANLTPALERAVGEVRLDHGLPGTDRVRRIYGSVWSSHLDDLLGSDNLGFWEALGAISSAVVLRGRFGDRRFHPVTAELLALIAIGRYTIFRDPVRSMAAVARFREKVEALWAHGYVIAMPVCCFPAPKVGRTNYNPQLLSCTMPGNLADATGLSIPFGRFANGMPRSIQLLGPPGSEQTLIDAAERMQA